MMGGEERKGGVNESQTFRKRPEILIYLGLICSFRVLILVFIDKYSVIYYTGLVSAVALNVLYEVAITQHTNTK